MTRDTSDPIREAVAGILGIAPEAVLTSCTHVHAGPSALTGTDAIGWPVPDGLRGRLVDRTTDAARGAVAALAATRARSCAPRSPTTSRSTGAVMR